MGALWDVIKQFPQYLWSGWGAIASLFLLIALWDWGYQVYGLLVLPPPLETFHLLWQELHNPALQTELWITLERALWGFLLAMVLGTVLGLLAGLFVTASLMSRPLITVFMGMPPIAWIVLAMMWFGLGDLSVIFTIVVATFPLVFGAALQGSRTLENNLDLMADSFSTPGWMKLTDIYFPHLFSYVFPAWIAAMGMSWKLVVMAELLASGDGIGAQLAVARTQLDTTYALALVLMMIVSLLALEYLVMEPIKREVEQWRS